MMLKYIYNKRIVLCIKLVIIVVICGVRVESIYADKDSNFRKKGIIIISATPMFGKEVEGTDRSTNNYFGLKSHNYQYGRYALDLAYNFFENLSIGIRYFETKNQKNSISYPNFPTVPMNFVNYLNSYEYELRYRQPASEIFVSYYPFVGNDFFVTWLAGKTAGTIESYHKNDLNSISVLSGKVINDYPSSVKITNDPKSYFGMGIGYRWIILENLLIDVSYDIKLPGKTKEFVSVNDNLFLLAIHPNSNTAIRTVSGSSATLTSVQSFYLRIGIAF
ncbi:hypothetical protein [Leptospira santarosai]|uniref:Outer membrane protein beta-barrel domain protein n=1 Tax=Leptospira santarosai TaxID=28183 RepID=A0AB73LWU6_9LEPT|nr:hypothetical protein [Leptospira santarosai]ONF92322.1 hypothetical protein BWD14_14015 [Leptospira santarosai]